MIMEATPEAIAAAGEALRRGALVVMPTETVYGLAGDATNARAVAAIFAAKGRPRFNPLIAHVLDLDAARAHAHLPPAGETLAAHFWPGPLTLVAPRKASSPIAELACAGLDTVALRAPAHAVARALIAEAQAPLVAPSANRSGAISPTQAAHAEEELGAHVAMVLDGGPCALGIESTIVGFDAAGAQRLLRPGAVTREAIEALIGPLEAARAGDIAAPGMLESHYAPRARVRLNAAQRQTGEVYLGFGASETAADANLSARGDLAEAAANLYAMLRALDARGPGAIAIAPIPETGLGAAINDRLRRAAAPRP